MIFKGPWLKSRLAEVEWFVPVRTIVRPCSLTMNADEAWSMVVEPNGSLANIMFLSRFAPHHLLVPGKQFEIRDELGCFLVRGEVIV